MVKKTKVAKNADSKPHFEIRPLRSAKPIADFMCFATPDPEQYIKCYWNAKESRFNLDCKLVPRNECIGGK